MAARTIRAPSYLQAQTREWFRKVHADYILEPHHTRIVTAAARMWDRGVAAGEAIDENGQTFEDRFGQPKERPEVKIERDAFLAYGRLVRELGLDISPPETKTRPPRIAYGGR